MSIANIACSAPDCHNPVIGQCTGYKKTCGKYYCREHSTGTLCFDCSNEKAAEEHAEAVYKEYLGLAENISKNIRIPQFHFQGNLLRFSGWSIVIGGVSLFFLLIIGVIVWNTNWEVPEILSLPYALAILGALAIAGWPFGIVPLAWLSQNQDWNNKERQVHLELP